MNRSQSGIYSIDVHLRIGVNKSMRSVRNVMALCALEISRIVGTGCRGLKGELAHPVNAGNVFVLAVRLGLGK